jgi:predicted nucleic acid-binding protein
MRYKYVIDSFAWIEYFRGTKIGKKAMRYIESGAAATATITIAELKEKYLKQNWGFFDEDLAFIITNTLVVPLDRAISVSAGEINYQMKKKVKDWGMSDSIVLATARISSAKVVTGDEHFKGVSDAIFLAT